MSTHSTSGARRGSSTDPDSRARLLEQLLDMVPDGVLVVGADGTILDANGVASKMFGFEPGGLAGVQLASLIPERYRRAHSGHEHRYRRHPAVRRMGSGLDLWARRSDGSEFPADISLGPGPDGATIAIVRDITSQQEQIERAREERDHRTAIIESLFAGLAETDVDGRIVEVNDRFCELAGAGRDEILSMEPPYPFWPRRHRTGDPAQPSRAQMVRADGSLVEVEMSVSPLTTGDGRLRGEVLLVLDVSERVRMEQQLRRAETTIALLEERDRIARDLHDLTIQRVLGVGISLQSMASGSNDPAFVGTIEAFVDELDEVIRELRKVIYDLNRPRRNLKEAIEAVVEEAASFHTLTPRLAFEGDPDAIGDEELVAHAAAVARELLSNAARHARADDVEVTVASDRWVTVLVRDNGVGLPDPPPPGRGLSNVRARAEAMGGSVSYDSAPGGGTAVRWRVPRPRRAL